MKKVPKEAKEEKNCPNCKVPMVIRDSLWICFTCAYELPAGKH